MALCDMKGLSESVGEIIIQHWPYRKKKNQELNM